MLHLLDLPPELLHNIYDWLRHIESRDNERRARRDKPPKPKTTAFISRSLWPYTRVYRLSNVTIRDYASLERFATTVAESSRLGAAVRTATLGVMRNWLEPGPGTPSESLRVALSKAWPTLTRVESISFVTLESAFDNLMAAVEGGLRLPALETLEVGSTFEAWGNPFALARWRPLFEAAPELKRLSISYSVDDLLPDELPALPVVLGPAFATSLRSLEVKHFAGPHEPAVANFVNAFPALRDLSLHCQTDDAQSRIISLLTPPIPGPSNLYFYWHAMGYEQADAFDQLDLRHFTGLTRFTLDSAQCAPNFRFFLPPSLRTLSLGCCSTVPLAALLELVRPGTPSHHLRLAELGLWLPYADYHNANLPDVSDMTIEEMADLNINHNYAMEWTREVSATALRQLIELTDEEGIFMYGNATAAFDFTVTWELREALQAGEQVAYDAETRTTLQQVARLEPSADDFRTLAQNMRKLVRLKRLLQEQASAQA